MLKSNETFHSLHDAITHLITVTFMHNTNICNIIDPLLQETIDEYYNQWTTIHSFIGRKAFNDIQINYGTMDIKSIQVLVLRLHSFNLFKLSEIKLRLKTNLMLTCMLHEIMDIVRRIQLKSTQMNTNTISNINIAFINFNGITNISHNCNSTKTIGIKQKLLGR